MNISKGIYLSLLVVLLSPMVAYADPVNSLPSPDTDCAMTAQNSFTAGPVQDCNYTWTSTNTGSVYGWTNGYGLGQNGSWNEFSHAGLNTSTGSMTFTFDNLVSDVLAFVNYAPGFGMPTMSILGDSNNLLESIALNFSTPGGLNAGEDWGFSRQASDIRSIVFSDAYIVATNIRSSATVPEPGTMALFGIGLAGMGLARRRRKA